MNDILFPESIQAGDPVGGKARALADLRQSDVAIPPWFVVLPGADSPAGDALDDAIARLGASRFAVRSSGDGEDGAGHSFAGQFETFLSVDRDAIPEKIAAVRGSASSRRLGSYREAANVPARPATPPAVIVQKMIDPDTAGVAFSADPVTGRRDVCLVSAVRGTGDQLVSGDADADTWKVSRRGGDITGRKTVTATPVLTDAEVRRIAGTAAQLEKHFGRPQDMEWALRGSELFVLQSRPITALPDPPDEDEKEHRGALGIWDNSNIVESYAGITTPLTFSFALEAYEHVYRQFCRLMRVPRFRIDAGDATFKNMLGLIRGRIYYNLINWYRVLAMLPGFRINRAFMEQMMGVKEPMPDEVVASVEAELSAGRFRDALNLAATVFGLLWNHATLPRLTARFHHRLEEALAPPATPLEEMSGAALVDYYRRTEERLLTRWDAPLVNDFLAMIYFGVLRALCRKWLQDESGSLANQFVRDTGGITSLEPVTRIREMAEIVRGDDSLRAALEESSTSTADKVARLNDFPVFAQAFEAYLEKFGDRCLEELKLESVPLTDDPAMLLHSVRAFASRPPESDSNQSGDVETGLHSRLESMNPLRRLVFERVLRKTRHRVRDRENLRFERTRVFGLVRRIMLEIGDRLSAEGSLAHRRDVFYLELREVTGAFRGGEATPCFKRVVAERKAEFAAWRDGEAPPDRFETRGEPAGAAFLKSITPAPRADARGSTLTGTGCCAGIVRGRVRVVTEPASAELRQGEILAARQTDPGWVMLFPLAAGLLVERGSLLSHSAIVAREMGLPAVVSLPSLTDWIRTGDFVELNGETGVVRKLK